MTDLNVVERTEDVHVKSSPGTVSVIYPGRIGDTGDVGDKGPQGVKGDTGVAVPQGGSVGQLLQKLSSTDYDDGWVNAPSPPPSGGATGELLRKSTVVDYETAWSSLLAKIVSAQLAGWYSFRAWRSSAYSIPGSATPEATLIFNTEDYDYANAYNPATGIYTAPIAGVYHFSSGIRWQMASSPFDTLEISFLVGSTWRVQDYFNTRNHGPLAVNDYGHNNLDADLKLNANDQVKVLAGHYVGTTAIPLNIGTGGQRNWFSGHLKYPV